MSGRPADVGPADDAILVPRASAAQLALHARLAAHHAAAAGAEPAAAEAVLAWAVLVASGEAPDGLDALPTPSDIVDDTGTLPAYRAAADQAEQMVAHFDYEERFDLVDLYGTVLSIVEGEIDRLTHGDPGAPEPAQPAGELTERELADLRAALDDEYHAQATYRQVLADFGDVLPFARIVESEGRHIEALRGLFRRYGVDVPADTWPGRAARYGSVAEACRAGVEAEVENAALYDRLLAGTERPDIQAVYRNLQEASQHRHLPAFRRCAERSEGGRSGGHGHGHQHQARRRGRRFE